MSPSPFLLWTVVATASVAGVGAAFRAATGAATEARDAATQLRAVAAHRAELLALRSRAGTLPSRAEGGLAALVSAALGRGGLDPAVLSGLTPEAERPLVAGSSAVAQRATLILSGVTLRELGGFLAAWQELAPAWVVSSLEIQPAAGRDPIPGGDLPLRAVLTLETVFLDDERRERGGIP